jgi:predicted enzyme related to lactoylglutathione lyase
VLTVVVDCHDPHRLAAFWQALAGGEVNERTASPDWLTLEGVAGIGLLSFQRVPEPKTVKNRLHLDVIVDDLHDARRTAAELGATVVGSVVEEPTNRFQVMNDPEGNEFCLVKPLG